MDLLAELNDPQRRAVQHVDGPLLVLAGAGSGKTRVITRRVAYLIEQGVAPWNILAITFTNKAAREMLERVEQLDAPAGATVCTFHALCARLLREFAEPVGLRPNYTIYDRDDQLRLVKDALSRANAPDGFQPARVHGAISRAKNDLITPQTYAERADESYFMRHVAPVYEQYERLLRANNAVDFDDLLLRVAYLLGDYPEVRELLGKRYRYVLIDEYQDTNRAQYLIAHGIALDHGNLCATGDPDQSIYAWRGADINNILEFEADHAGAVVIRLEENYRSTAPILAAASHLISHNKQRKDKALWTRKTGGADVRVVYSDTEHAEADLVVDRIREHQAGGGAYGEVAVFYRVNSLSRVMEDALRKAAMPYRIARGVEFYNRKEIRDVLAYLKLLANPQDDIACGRIINTPARGIGAVTVKKLRAYAESAGESLLAACRVPEAVGLGTAATKRVRAFAEMILALAGEVDRPVRQTVEQVLLRAGFEDAFNAAQEDERQAGANVAELVTAAAEFDATGGSLSDYLHQVSLVSDTDHFKGTGGAVTLMTLHAAKGLEFDTVFVIGCEHGLLPILRDGPGSGGSVGAAEMEEERRLAFVGMTRAREHLTLSCARQRRIRGMRTSQIASPFLAEIGSEGVRVEDASERRRPAARPYSGGGFYAEPAQRQVIEDMVDAYEEVPAEFMYLRPGCRVSHPDFGIGHVTKLARPWPHTQATVHFEEVGPRKITVRTAHLEILDAEF